MMNYCYTGHCYLHTVEQHPVSVRRIKTLPLLLVQFFLVNMYRPLSNTYVQNVAQIFLKVFPYYAFQCSHCACIMCLGLYILKNSCVAFISLGWKSCEIEGSGQEMVAMMIMIACLDFTSLCISALMLSYYFLFSYTVQP